MKPNQVNKLYSKLTPHEQANLAFEANANGDNANFEAINSAVEWHNYNMPHYDYRTRSFGLLCLAWYYRGEYWQALAKWVLGLATSNGANVRQYSERLAAMNTALNQICEELNVEVQAVKKLADCCPDYFIDTNCPIRDESKHAELVKEYTELFKRMF